MVASPLRHGGRSRGQRGRPSPLGGAAVSGRAATPFASLTAAGQQRRLRTVAREALRAHRGRVAGLHLHATAFNTVFRVDLVGGTRRALRVSPALRIHPRKTEQLEAAWTDQISDQTSISVARVCPDRNGGGFLIMTIVYIRSSIHQSRQEYFKLQTSGQSLERLIHLNCENYNLTAREREIVGLIVKGHPYKIIGSTLNISEKTVAKHVSNIFAKVSVTNKVEMIYKLEAR